MWRYFGASCTGASHERASLPCQDRFECRALEPGWLLVAVSDGAGSASRAETGAELSVLKAVEELVASISGGEIDARKAVYRAFVAARAAVLERAQMDEIDPREYSATLLIVAAGPQGGAFGQIGDGVITVKADPDGWSYVFWPQNGEYANVTRFVTDVDAPDWFQCDSLMADVQEFAVMTDGLEPLALQFATKSVHSPFFEGFALPLRSIASCGEHRSLSVQLNEFLRSPTIQEKVDDDLTMVIASRLGM